LNRTFNISKSKMAIDTSNLYIYVTIITSLITAFYLFTKYKQRYWSKRGVYSPPVNWFFGHFGDVFLQRISSPAALSNLYNCSDERVVGIYVMQKPFLIVRCPELLKHIFIKDFKVFPNHYFASKRQKDTLGSSNLFSIDNPLWKYLRNKMSSIFTTGKQKIFFELILESSKHLQQYLVQNVPKDKIVTLDIKLAATKYTTDVISSLSFGINTNSFDPSQQEFFNRSKLYFIS
jgi:cytochrome P450 family 6